MVIYCIRNKKDSKRLIGQTTRAVKIRWKEHITLARNQKHENPRFQSAWNKCGSKQFVLEIIRDNVKSQKELDKLEEYYRKKYWPNVYNIRTGGNGGCKFSEATKKKMSKTHKKLHREHPEQVSQAAKIRWSDPNSYIWRKITNERMWKNIAIRTKISANRKNAEKRGAKLARTHTVNLRSPSGKEYETIFNFRKFCRIHSLDRGNIKRVILGESQSHRGWTKI